MQAQLSHAIRSVPPGPWAVALSGGADSAALLTLLVSRADLSLHVVHLNHETRGGESDGDGEFVLRLAERLGLPHTIEKRSEIEKGLTGLPRNPSARYRRVRLALFRRVVLDHHLNGVLLAHHADDQAETVLHRLLRGSGHLGLTGMSVSGVIGGVRCCRPLLSIRREALRDWLRESNQPWREDSSNQSAKYMRNRLRVLLQGTQRLTDALLELAAASTALRNWQRTAGLTANRELNVRQVADLPSILARSSARNWLIGQGIGPSKIEPRTIEQLLAMCLDASTPARMQFPDGVMLRRRKQIIQRVNSEPGAWNLPSEPQQL